MRKAKKRCSAISRRFTPPIHLIDLPGQTTANKLIIVVRVLFSRSDRLPFLWTKVRRRREAITLEELQTLDWGGFSPDAERVLRALSENVGDARVRQESLDYFALILATVFVPLARAEMNRMRRNIQAAVDEYERILTPHPTLFISGGEFRTGVLWLTCDFIERPFVLLALGEIRMEKAEVQFKAASQGKADDARTTYQSILELFKDHGAYVARVTSAHKILADSANQLPQLPPDRKDIALQVFGKDVTGLGIESNTRELPGLCRTKAPAESWLQFQDTVNGEVNAETNPRIYALLLNAQTRLLQIEHGFNYLGYKDDYIPPWRFQFLLDRARYFAEHAKNAQREYLNFLSNAEREEFQEFSASQNVEMEKSNVHVETARVDQVRLEVESAKASETLAMEIAQNANARLLEYEEFDQRADDLAGTGKSAKVSRFIASFDSPSNLIATYVNGFLPGFLQGGNEVLQDVRTAARDFYTGGFASRQIDRALASEQREYEKFGLGLAAQEAGQAAEVATRQLAVATAGLVVASLQRQAALLRHEFAIQNLQYLRNRTLNAEQWFRLANAIRGVADTYLRYAIELAFLSEQAYEFEADKRINVIRFDYDQSEVGAYLAADFLLRDLDTIEQDLIVNQRQRQQQVRYVLSMAREFPAALEELRENGRVSFLLRLEQIEKRFPGLYNVRVGMVDVLPVALMDSTRFSLDLTHTGSGQLRIKGQPDVRLGEQSESVLNVSDLPARRLRLDQDTERTLARKSPDQRAGIRGLFGFVASGCDIGFSRGFVQPAQRLRGPRAGRRLADRHVRPREPSRAGQPRRSADHLHRVGLPRFRSARGHRWRQAPDHRADQFSVRAAHFPGRLLRLQPNRPDGVAVAAGDVGVERRSGPLAQYRDEPPPQRSESAILAGS